jgi:hypothetical protein
MPAKGFKSPSVPATPVPTAPPALGSGPRGLPWPRVIRYTLCNHEMNAATSERMTHQEALALGGFKAVVGWCPKCQPPVKRLPAKECDEWP